MTNRRTKGLTLERIRLWLHQPQRATGFWLGKYCVEVAWLGLALALFSPPHGSGVMICWLQSSTGLPCPGCGMTRSLSCGIRGMFSESLHYHPFGLFVLTLFIFTAAQSLSSKATRERVIWFIQDRATLFNCLYIVFVVTFVSFGIIRAVLHMGGTWLTSR